MCILGRVSPSPSMEPQASSSSSVLKFILGILVVLLLGFVFVLDGRRREAEQRLKQISVRLEQVQNPAQNKALAQEVLTKVRKHFILAEDPEPTVATIVDVEKLRERNVFYQKAENGYHLIITADRALLYDPQGDIIVDVAPIQLQTVQSSSEPSAE